MKITLKRKNEAVLFTAANSEGNEVMIDGSPTIGGVNGGFRPMELLLAAAASCSVMDIVSILKKQRQNLVHIEIDSEGDRSEEGDLKPFTSIHLHYRIYGDVKESRAEKAVSLSVEKYCSVIASLGSSVKVSSSFEILPAEAARRDNE